MGAPSAWRLSFECSHGRKHVNEDWVILEAVDDVMQPVPDGTLSASVLLTVLANEVQPFIRYDLGDCVRYDTERCPCGSPFRSFQVEGREATARSCWQGDAVAARIRSGARASPGASRWSRQASANSNCACNWPRARRRSLFFGKSSGRLSECFAIMAWTTSWCGKARRRPNSPRAASSIRSCRCEALAHETRA